MLASHSANKLGRLLRCHFYMLLVHYFLNPAYAQHLMCHRGVQHPMPILQLDCKDSGRKVKSKTGLQKSGSAPLVPFMFPMEKLMASLIYVKHHTTEN